MSPANLPFPRSPERDEARDLSLYRKQLVCVAALAVAAIETHDRQQERDRKRKVAGR